MLMLPVLTSDSMFLQVKSTLTLFIRNITKIVATLIISTAGCVWTAISLYDFDLKCYTSIYMRIVE